jgi:predicted P-loop ATPase
MVMTNSVFAISLFADYFAKEITVVPGTLDDLANTIRTTTAPAKAQLSLLKLARFGNTPIPHTGSLRHDQNLVVCTGVEGDYDAGEVTLDEAHERLLKANITAVLCTTPSHSPEKPKWRVLAPFEAELPPTDRSRMVDRLNGALGGILAAESWTLSQSFYYGSVNGNPDHRVEIIEGEFIDQLDDLDLIAIGKPNGGNGAKGDGGNGRAGGPVDEEALKAAIVSGEAYHESCTRLLGLWIRQGVGLDEAERRLFEMFDSVDASLRDARWAERRADTQRTVDGIYGKDARRQDDADAEFSRIQSAIDALKDGDSASPIINRIAAAWLPATVEGQLLNKIKQRGFSIKDLRDELKDAKNKLKEKNKRKDVSLTTANWTALVKRYADLSDNPGEIRPMMVNVAIIIRGTPEFRDAIWYNEFTDKVTVKKPLPWDQEGGFKERDFGDYDELKMTEWLQGMDDFINVPPHIVHQGVDTVAHERSYHPVRDYLNGLVWDEEPRIDNLLTKYFGANREDPNYLKAISAKALIQAVARIFRPGIKADCMLTLEGEQGVRKSTAMRMIFDPLDQGWFSDDAGELGTTDSKMKLRGKWGVELGEFAGLTKLGIRQAKAFLSSTDDEYRPPYGRRQKRFPRENVFIGSTNDDEVLNDPSGGRRFWFAWCSQIDFDALWSDRHQLWAEAVHRYRKGERWHIDDREIEKAAKAEQSKRQESDVWDGQIISYLNKFKEELEIKRGTAKLYEADPNADPGSRKNAVYAAGIGVTISAILTVGVGKPLASSERKDQLRISAVLRRLGWTRERVKSGSMRDLIHYLPPTAEPED